MVARRTVLGGVLLLSVWTGCAAEPRPVAKVEPPPATEQAPPEEPPAQPETPPEAPPEEPPKSQVIVVESGGEEETSSRTLVEAARAERERKAQAGPPVAVITNKTLPKYAKGQVTVAEPKKKGDAGTVAPDPERKDEQQYWRSQGLELRLRWREAEDEVGRLEQSASEWRRRFYAQDDPYVRDGQIKPEWDRTLDRLDEARAEVEATKQDLARFLEEGRQAGALPGWLREGVDQEPKPKAEEPPPGEPVEPTVLDEDGVKYEPSSPPPRLH
ncbi:MAG TPA: hypothetical protein VMW27_24200 [Thermoanaerobaculia bacterium]|nr:hypothetical protein [Thermoanaerobaculia bacterium]